jgi:hypothetical protein
MSLSDVLPMVEQLSETELDELRRWLDERTEDNFDAEIAHIMDERLAHAKAHPEELSTMDDAMRRVRAYAADRLNDPSLL